jgi:hypothetical protein
LGARSEEEEEESWICRVLGVFMGVRSSEEDESWVCRVLRVLVWEEKKKSHEIFRSFGM